MKPGKSFQTMPAHSLPPEVAASVAGSVGAVCASEKLREAAAPPPRQVQRLMRLQVRILKVKGTALNLNEGEAAKALQKAVELLESSLNKIPAYRRSTERRLL